jgi:hypothetical protein
MVKAVTFATLILACVLLIEAAPATTKINEEIRSMCSYYTGKFIARKYSAKKVGKFL